jgi:hypothetical protein
MIDEAVAQRAVNAVGLLAGEYWSGIDFEIQDGSTFLLVRANAPTEATLHVSNELRREIAKTLTAVIPPHASQPLGSWMVVVKFNGQVCESILPNEL